MRRSISHILAKSIGKLDFKLLIASFILLQNIQFCYAQEQVKDLTELEKTALTINEIMAIEKQDKSIKNPKVPEGYEIELIGTDRLQVINNNGDISSPIVNSDVHLYYQLIDKKTNNRTDIPNIHVTVPGTLSKSESDNPCPEIIPAIREWKGRTGYFSLNECGNIVVDTDNYNTLKKSIDQFADDFKFFGKLNYKLVSGTKTNNDIFITLNCNDNALGEEGYKLTIDNGILLEANTPKGILMGTQTILQLVNRYNNTIPKGIARDYPKYARRGFMLDVGRKFFSIDFLRDYVRIMSYYKMNEFHIHLNDNGFKQYFENDWSKTYSSFRLESETYPGLTSKDGFYSKKEFTALQQLGMDYGVNVIPEIDIPAHSLAFTKYRPDIGSKEYGMDHLDINNPETYEFLDRLFEEYLSGENPVFIGTDVHVGTDEYDKKEAESFRKFTDHYLKKVQSFRKRARLWGSLTHANGNTPVTSENVIMNAWYNGYANPKDMIDQGFELISTSDRHLYIVPAADYYYDYLNLEFLYNKWEPNMIGGVTFPFGHPQISGGMFAVWNDHCGNGITEKDVHHRAFQALQVLSAKMWIGKNNKLQLDEFKTIASKLAEAPNVNIMGRVQHIGNTVLHYDFSTHKNKDLTPNNFDIAGIKGVEWEENNGYVFNEEISILLPLEEIGYPYEVSFEITFDSQMNSEVELFSSRNAKVFAIPKNGKIELSFKREGYHYKFRTLLDKNRRQSITIKGDHKGTSLCIEGEEVERLQGIVKEYKKENGQISKMYIQQTLVFPLRTIGKFKGVLHSLKIKTN